MHENASPSARGERFAHGLPAPGSGAGQLWHPAPIPLRILQLRPRLSATSVLLRWPACLLPPELLLPSRRLHPLPACILFPPILSTTILLSAELLRTRLATGLLRKLLPTGLGSRLWGLVNGMVSSRCPGHRITTPVRFYRGNWQFRTALTLF